MNIKKGLLVAATAFGLTVIGAGLSPASAAGPDADIPETSVSGIHSSITNQEAAETLNNIYDKAYIGEMPGNVHDLNINEDDKEDVYHRLGSPQQEDGQFDLYGWNMGNPGYGFAYNEDNSIAEIRYFGTGVERQTNLGGITPAVLDEQLGSADEILHVPQTNETDYVYNTDNYELHFIVGSDDTVDHVNLKEAK
ncbi:YjgB family protein [Virgibacillus sp. NKC19-3]|uniref:YjgB family protein n=1 Tax=Virgibacillus saliphilus TaxID=2831674 RepID=UPI001C9AE62D|nr:YjgB family protein [Virgibacillus sp. NKC19-3]MBY7142542.1 YjgB family protein [Virgibacillus sp. NKC19-3]